jgi:hypothetical protein
MNDVTVIICDIKRPEKSLGTQFDNDVARLIVGILKFSMPIHFPAIRLKVASDVVQIDR